MQLTRVKGQQMIDSEQAPLCGRLGGSLLAQAGRWHRAWAVAPHLARGQQEACGVSVMVSHQVEDGQVLSSLSLDAWVHLAAVPHQLPRLPLHRQGLSRPPAQAGDLHWHVITPDRK